MTDLERLARILCEADGCDPDALVYDQVLGTDKRGRVFAPLAPPLPSWQHYLFLARTSLEAIMTGAENTDLHAMLKEMLEAPEVQTPEELTEEAPTPPQARNWRVIYGLSQPN